MKNRLIFGILISLVLISVMLAACNTPATPASVSNSANQATKTIKLGILLNTEVGPGLGMVQGFQAAAAADNQKGGLSIGGIQYKFELVTASTGTTQDTEINAANKLIYEDKVKYLIQASGPALREVVPIAEKEKVVLFTPAMSIPDWDPNWQYTFDGSATAASDAVVTGWICNRFAEQSKNTLLVYPDSQIGNLVFKLVSRQLNAFGVKPQSFSFPASTQDYSSVATKVANMNPGLFCCVTVDPNMAGLVFNAVRNAGYTGQFFMNAPAPFAELSSFSAASKEGLVLPAVPTEFEPALNPTAEQFKTDFKAMFGKWTSPSLLSLPNYFCLKAALVKAGSTDVDKVVSVLSSGLEYDSPQGPCKMIARGDIGVTRTVNSVYTTYMKTVKDGKPTLLASMSPNESLAFLNTVLNPSKPK